jgi:putative ATP-binding cassette transporter
MTGHEQITLSNGPRESAWVFRKFWRVTKAYWFGDQRWSALSILAVIFAVVVAKVYSMVMLNEAGGRFFTAMQTRSESGFYYAMLLIGSFLLFQLVCIVVQTALTEWLEIRWRRWLTSHLIDRWLSLRSYYRLRFSGGADNPDQRIAEDIRFLTSGTLTLSIGLISTILTVMAFAGVLWTVSGSLPLAIAGFDVTIPGYMFWAALLYWLVGSALGFVVGNPLIRLNNRQQGLEADFRFALVRVREKAEGIALYGGERREHVRTKSFFDLLYGNSLRIIRQNAKLLSFQTFLGSGPEILPYLAVAPRYFSGAMELGDVMRIGNGFGQISRALSWLVTSYGTYAEWHATVDRLAEFQDELKRLAARPNGFEIETSDNGSHTLEGVTASLPSGIPIFSDISLDLKPEERVLIKGMSGMGKSTLFCVIAGLWPSGRGRILLPNRAKSLFLPQKPYIPIGTLRSALWFPVENEQQLVDGKPDDEVRNALAAVGLKNLSNRLDEKNHWEQVLSPGEQQRLAVAQALLVKPDWLFLDEATSALDEAQEANVYQAIANLLPRTTIVSIGHRRSIEPFHSRVVVFESSTSSSVRGHDRATSYAETQVIVEDTSSSAVP